MRHAADAYDIHPITIRHWIAARLISSWRVGGKVMVDLDEIDTRIVRRVSTARGGREAEQ